MTIQHLMMDFTKPGEIDVQNLFLQLLEFIADPSDQEIKQVIDGLSTLAVLGWDLWEFTKNTQDESVIYAMTVMSHALHSGEISTQVVDDQFVPGIHGIWERARIFDLCKNHVYNDGEQIGSVNKITCRRCGYPGEQSNLTRMRDSLTQLLSTMAQNEAQNRLMDQILDSIQRFANNTVLEPEQRLRIIENMLTDREFLNQHFERPFQKAKQEIELILDALPPQDYYDNIMAELEAVTDTSPDMQETDTEDMLTTESLKKAS